MKITFDASNETRFAVLKNESMVPAKPEKVDTAEFGKSSLGTEFVQPILAILGCLCYICVRVQETEERVRLDYLCAQRHVYL